ncbi:MAG: DNA-binding protein [Rhodospirillaceae bacterium TMED8]|nr:DNA-binding protein [Magnetovibrio sp.]OUT50357.1 MAG: DNA-binding protein [Rhodospirillaceae bacterium TMED8]|tara:strand:- start:5460 stop:5948 length:489 start_codon:yes stop_codon:yes gene_type:complete
MSVTKEDLLAQLCALGIETETVDHAAVYTVEDAKSLRRGLPGTHSKNLFLKDKKSQFWLIVAHEDRNIDLKGLSKQIGAAQLSFGKPEALMTKLGVEPGSVTPFAVINDRSADVTVILDEEMLAREPLHFHPLVNTATTTISKKGLLRFLQHTGHQPLVLAL